MRVSTAALHEALAGIQSGRNDRTDVIMELIARELGRRSKKEEKVAHQFRFPDLPRRVALSSGAAPLDAEEYWTFSAGFSGYMRDNTSDLSMYDHGTFKAVRWAGKGNGGRKMFAMWVWRDGVDTALVFHQHGQENAFNNLWREAIGGMVSIDKAHGRAVVDNPVPQSLRIERDF